MGIRTAVNDINPQADSKAWMTQSYPLRSLEHLTYSVAVIGGGFSAASTIANLANNFRSLYEESSSDSDLRMVKPPSMHITVFEPSGILGIGKVFGGGHPEIEDTLKSTTRGEECSILYNKSTPYSNWKAEIQEEGSGRPSRTEVGKFNAWEIDQILTSIAEQGLPFHVEVRKHLVESVSEHIIEGLGNYSAHVQDGVQFDGFDSVVLASGHAPNRTVIVGQKVERYIGNFYEEYDKLKELIGSRPERIIIAGFGPSAYELLEILDKLQYDGELVLVCPSSKETFASLEKGYVENSNSHFMCYLADKFDLGKARFINGRVDEYIENENGSKVLGHCHSGQTFVETGPLIMGAPFSDGVDLSGYGFHPLIEKLQRTQVLPLFPTDRCTLIDEFNRVEGVEPMDKDTTLTTTNIFMAGRAAHFDWDSTVDRSRNHGENLGWWLLQHAIYTNWQKQAVISARSDTTINQD